MSNSWPTIPIGFRNAESALGYFNYLLSKPDGSGAGACRSNYQPLTREAEGGVEGVRWGKKVKFTIHPMIFFCFSFQRNEKLTGE